MSNRGSAMSNFSPAQLFIGGIVAGILVLCTIGFFILLQWYMRAGKALAGGNPTVVAANDQVAPPAAAQNNNAPPPTAPGNFRPVDVKADHVRGPARAKVTLIEYSDFECPFCGRFFPTVKQVMDKYPNDVRLVYRHFPLSFHPQAAPAAEASECASEQGKFWEYHDALFTNQPRLGADLYKELAANLKLNIKQFSDCVSSGKYRSKVQEQEAEGGQAGVQGTPHTIVVGASGKATVVSGAQPYENVEAAIKQMLN